MGDIALPNINYDRELSLQKPHTQEEVEKYKQEVLEGLQIEEEGLTAFIRKKSKQASIFTTQRIYNDPIDNDPSADDIPKKNQKINVKSYAYLGRTHDKNKKHDSEREKEERLLKTQSNSREIFEIPESFYQLETTTQKTKVRHNRRDGNSNNKNRRGRKGRRRKNRRGKNR